MGSMKNILIEAEDILNKHEAQLMEDGTSLEGDLLLGSEILLDEHTVMKVGLDEYGWHSTLMASEVDVYDNMARTLFIHWHKRNFQPPPNIGSKQHEVRLLYGLE